MQMIAAALPGSEAGSCQPDTAGLVQMSGSALHSHVIQRHGTSCSTIVGSCFSQDYDYQ